MTSEGLAFALDFGNRDIVGWNTATGRVVTRIGGSGSGPGEFELPVAMGLQANTLSVVDAGTRHLTSFSLEGTYLGSRSLTSVPTGRTTIGADGSLTVELRGAGGFLVGVFDVTNSVRRVGRVIGVDGPWNFTAIREEARAGRIHPITRSQALGVTDLSGAVWVVQQTENLILRFDREGNELVHRSLLSPDEWKAALREYAESNRAEKSPDVVHPLMSATDMRAVGTSLYVLLSPATGPGASVVQLDSTGQRRREYIIDGIDQPIRICYDQAHRRFLLSSVAEGAVYVAAIPQ